jgi:hypothetical protein
MARGKRSLLERVVIYYFPAGGVELARQLIIEGIQLTVYPPNVSAMLLLMSSIIL